MKRLSNKNRQNHIVKGEATQCSTRWQLCIFLMVLVIVVLASDWNYVSKSYFVGEYFEFIFGARVVGYDLRATFLDHTRISHMRGRYRPFLILTSIILDKIFGVNPRYHLLFLFFLKIACALSIYLCGREVFRCNIPPMVAALIFATNPVFLWTFRGQRHITLLLTVFVILTWYFYEKYLDRAKPKFRLLALVFTLVSIMYHEHACVIPIFLLLYSLLRNLWKPTGRGIKESVILPCYPFFILVAIFATISYFAGGLGGYNRSPFTVARLWINLGYLFHRIPAAFLDLWGSGLFVSILKPYTVYWIGLWLLLLLLSLGSSLQKTFFIILVSLVYYICFMAPVFQLLHIMRNTPRYLPGMVGLCFCAGGLFIWSEAGGKWKKLLGFILLSLIIVEFSASTNIYWKKHYQEETKTIETICLPVANHVLANYKSAPPGTVFVILIPEGTEETYCSDYYIKGLGGRALSQYLFLAISPQASRHCQVIQIPEILWDYIWCEPVEEKMEWPVFTWKKRDETSVTFRQALQSEHITGRWLWVSREGLKWKEVETAPPILDTLREMGLNTYYLRIVENGHIIDLGSDMGRTEENPGGG